MFINFKNSLFNRSKNILCSKLFKVMLFSIALFISFSDLSFASNAGPCDPSLDPGGSASGQGVGCASLWSVKFATRTTSFNYIWIVFLCCAVISVSLLFGALNAFKAAGDGGQGNTLKKPIVLIVLAGCMISLPHFAKIAINGTFGDRAGKLAEDDMYNTDPNVNPLGSGDLIEAAPAQGNGGTIGMGNDEYDPDSQNTHELIYNS